VKHLKMHLKSAEEGAHSLLWAIRLKIFQMIFLMMKYLLQCLLIKESVVLMKEVINVQREDVFTQLAKGIDVYVVDPIDCGVFNLKHETVADVLHNTNSEIYAFFMVAESEDK